MLRHVSKRLERVPARLRMLRSAQAVRRSSTDADVFMQGTNATYIDEMYESWRRDPSSVHVSWQSYFRNLDHGRPSSQSFQSVPAVTPVGHVDTLPASGSSLLLDHLKVQLLVRTYQVAGHFRAKVDPLKKSLGFSEGPPPSTFRLEHYGWTEADLDKEIQLGSGILPRFMDSGKQTMTIREIIDTLEKTYCGSYGIQYMHIPSREQCDWIRERVEVPVPFKFSIEEKRRILDRLMWATLFEQFLSTKFPNDKRFGLEGGETMVPGMKELIDRCVEHGVVDVVIGMAHRGRLNVLSNVVRKPYEAIFNEFSGSATFDEGSGDVKYHLGMYFERPTSTTAGSRVSLSLVANPSHLEAEDPVVLGQVRAIQHKRNDLESFTKSLGILVHGDAAVEAQGIVYETLGTHKLEHYRTGGAIHIIVNNQIGFTTDPRDGRSTPYPSDFAKTIDAPIFHVNGDDIEAVVFIFQLAADWRARFKTEVIIDLLCYRKHGHNETDQPSFTQPIMYKTIAKKTTALEQYIDKLISEGTFTEQDIKEHHDWIWGIMEAAFNRAKDYRTDAEEWVTVAWKDFKTVKELATEILPHEPTSLTPETFKEVGTVVSTWPESLTVHRNLSRILKTRLKSIESGEGIDWSTAEALAFGSLLKEGFHVRVSGEDVERGTFSQRHAVLHDQNDGHTYTPLETLGKAPQDFVISNSHLSEYGVLGFEYGYSLYDPRNFVMWEAQFGDFANTAQVIIDQFIAAGECKWMQRSGIVLSLPHGYDGQGPEHSSARLERYLQLADEDPLHFPSAKKLERQHQDANIQVAYPTTPANLFHLLRRQMHRQFRKPLILLFSKALLRHPLARSNMEDFTGNSGFQWIIEDPEIGQSINDREGIRRLILCTGQVHVQLHKYRADNNIVDTAYTRIEQLHPFPWAQLRDLLDKYPNLQDIVWCQEEHLNGGGWSYVLPRMQTLLPETKNYGDFKLRYAGRAPSASVATGSKHQHSLELEELLRDAFQVWL